MVELWLARHGLTDWNVKGMFQGHSDPPLNPDGRMQIQALAEKLRDIEFTALYSSDLQRAVQTAEILNNERHLPLQIDSRLREISFGEWESLNYEQVMLDEKARWDRGIRDHSFPPTPGGETIGQVTERVCAALDDITQENPDGPVLIASHGISLATLVCMANCLSLNHVIDEIFDHGQAVQLFWPPAERSSFGLIEGY